MKNLWKLMTSSLLVASLFAVSCSDDDTPATPTPEGNHFAIEVTSLDGDWVYFNVTPDDEDRAYFYWMIEYQRFVDEYNSDLNLTIQTEIDKAISEWIDGWGGTFEEASEMMLSYGPVEANNGNGYNVSGNRSYIIFAAYVEVDSAAQTLVVVDTPSSHIFESTKVEPSDMTFDVEVTEITSRGATINITPSNNEEMYSYLVIESAAITESEPASKIVEDYVNSMGMFVSLFNGAISEPASYDALFSDTDYSILIYGYRYGVVTTPIHVTEFTTSQACNPADCTFEFSFDRIHDYMVSYSVTPSSDDVDYYFDVVNAEANTAELVKQYLEDGVASLDWVSGIEEYLTIFATTGSQDDKTFITPGSSIRVYAVAVNKATGEYAGDFFISEPFTAPAAVVSETATIQTTIDGFYDGTELVELMPWYSGYEDKAIFYPTFTTSEDIAGYYYQLFEWDDRYENTLQFNDTWAITALVDQGYTFSDMEMIMPFASQGLFMAVAYDSEGHFGPVHRIERLTFNRDEALSAEDHPQYTPESSAPSQKPVVLKKIGLN